MNSKFNISVVIPLYNEEESLQELTGEIFATTCAANLTCQVIFIDDGSNDSSWDVVSKLTIEYPNNICAIKFRRNYGKSAALYCGFKIAEGEVIITMDADLQDSPAEIPELYRMITEEDYDLVSGWKRKRYDPLGKTLPSKFFNATARFVSGIKLNDFNCGLKAYKNKVIKSIEVYGEMHRYIPILAKQAGFKKIGEKVVEHRSRKYGVSKFGWERMIKGYLDLLSVMFITRFGKSPMYFFGSMGTVMFMGGGVIAIYLIIEKLVRQANDTMIRQVTDQPLFYIALVAIIIGVQMFLAGFLGELVGRKSTERNDYLLDDTINI